MMVDDGEPRLIMIRSGSQKLIIINGSEVADSG